MMRWLVSYADFITLLSAIFFVWFATAQVDREKFERFLEGFQQATHAEQPVEGGQGLLEEEGNRHSIKPQLKPAISRREKIAKAIRRSFEESGFGKQVNVAVEERGIVIRLLTQGEQPVFDLGKADLKPKAREVLQKVAWVLLREKIKTPIRIEGHTDNLPISTPEFPSNWELSTRRATNVLRFLIQMGIPPKQLQAAGYADTKPAVKPNPRGGTPKNRRVEIIILMGKEKR